jgi:hypothetical protein
MRCISTRSASDSFAQERNDPRAQATFIGHLAFPNHHYLPTALTQLSLCPLISFRVPLNLRRPICASRRWDAAPATTVHVPEATIDVDDLSQPSKDKIGRARQ